MREILLSQEKVALVDDEDYDRLMKNNWYAFKDRNVIYALRCVGRNVKVRMPHDILGFKTANGMMVDHIDGNGLNNQKSNLRIVTNRENQQNRHVGDSSKYPGVSYNKAVGKWQSSITTNKVRTHFGSFTNEFEAFKTYVVASSIITCTRQEQP